MNIELTALEAGTLVIFSIAVTGIVMSLRKRVLRNKKQKWIKEKSKVVEETEFKATTETTAPKKVQEQPESQEHGKDEPIDTDALLKDLKDREKAK